MNFKTKTWRLLTLGKLSFIEIGNILGITDNNAKIRLYRSVERLRKTYKKITVEKEI